MDVVVVITVVNGFDEALQLPYGTTMDHKNKSDPHRVLHVGQAVVQLTYGLDRV